MLAALCSCWADEVACLPAFYCARNAPAHFAPPPRRLKPFAQALAALWDVQRRWLQHALARAAVWVGLLAGLSTLAANVWGVPAINRRLLPLATQQAAVVLQREVGAGGGSGRSSVQLNRVQGGRWWAARASAAN